ncbi:hypothetical protein Tco_0024960 [Tanacetum coccineum]
MSQNRSITALDNALVPPEKRLKIERCNARIAFSKPQREDTYQVTLEALKLSPCYPAFQITAKVPEIYMHKFWNTITKIRDIDAYSFKLDKKKCRVDTEVFCEILQISLNLPNQEFVALPSEDEFLSFIKELGYSGKCTMLRESRAQILWGMYNKKNVDYVALLWEDFMYQADNREISSARKEHMPYPRFTKVIINHFISKDKTISMRNRINLHTVRDDPLLGTLKFVSKTEDSQKYGALIPDEMINQNIKDSKAYKTYYDFATGKVKPKKARAFKKVASPLRILSPVLEAEPVNKAKRVKRPVKKSTTAPTTGVVIKDTLGVSVSKNKTPAKADRVKGIELLSDAALLEAAQVKEALKKSNLETHKVQASGSSEGGDSQDDESNDDDDDNDSENKDDDTKDDDGDSNDDDDSEKTDSDADKIPDLNLNDDEEEHNEEYKSDDKYENVFEEEDDDDLYKDVDMKSLGAEREKERKGDEEMTDADQNVSQEQSYEQVVEDAHVTLTTSQETGDSKQSSSVSLDFANQFLILEKAPPSDHEVASLMNIKMSHKVPSTQISSPLTEPATVIPDSSTAVSTTLSQIKQADLSAQVFESVKSQLPTMVDDLLSTKIGYATRTALQSYTQEFEKKAQEEMKVYIGVVKKSVKDIIKDEVKSLLPRILPKEVSNFATPVIQSTINESLENVILAKSFSQPKSTYEAAESLTEFELKKILLNKMERSESYKTALKHKELYEGMIKSYNLNKILFSSYEKAYSLKRDHKGEDKDEDPSAGLDRRLKKRKTSKDIKPLRGSKSKESKSSSSKGSKSQSKSSGKSAQAKERVFEIEASKHDWFKKPEKPPTPYCDWNKGKQINFRPPQTWISKMAKSGKPPTTFDKLMSTHIDFSAYVLHNLKIENLSQELLVGPDFNLLKGTCKSRVELEFHLEECYKAVNDKLDWHNPEGHEYPFDLSKPLPLIKDQGRQVVPANYFFNNDLEYLKGGSSSRKYATSITKTKAAKYDNIEGIEDMVQTLWSPVKVAYDKHAIWGTSHWVTHVKVVKYDYGYLEEIEVRREDHSYISLRKETSQDLICVILKTCFHVSTSINITPYTAYNDLQGIIYQDKFQRNRLMPLDELYKFCDGTLSSVQRVLIDIAYRLEMD